MGADKLQIISQFILFLGIFLTILGSIGSIYFGGISRTTKDEAAFQDKMELEQRVRMLKEENVDIHSSIKSFETLAIKVFPEMSPGSALAKLYVETENAIKRSQLTYFVTSELLDKQLEDGSYEYTFELHPEGSNIVPVLSLSIQSIDESKISSLDIQGGLISSEFQEDKSDDRTSFKRVYHNVTPAVLKVIVHTTRKTQLRVGVYPLKAISK